MSEPMTSSASILELVAHRVDVLAELGAHDGEDDERALARRALEHGPRDLLGADARVEADLRAGMGELEHRGAHDLLGGLARRVAEDVDVPRLLRHGFSRP